MTATPHLPHHHGHQGSQHTSLGAQAIANLPQALVKLDPRHLVRQPVIFVVWIGSVLTTVLAVLHPTGLDVYKRQLRLSTGQAPATAVATRIPVRAVFGQLTRTGSVVIVAEPINVPLSIYPFIGFFP